MEKQITVLVLLGFLLSSLVFAVGGGGGGGSAPIPLPQIVTDYSCSDNILIVKVTSSADSLPLEDAEVKVIESKSGVVFASSKTDSSGTVTAKITDDGKYLVSASKSGFKFNSVFVFINCRKEKGLNTAANASSSPIIQKEPDFYCTEGKTMRERVKCYLKLSVEKIDQVKYVPEECNVDNETKKNSCVSLYRKLQSCRKEGSKDLDREKCAKPKLKLSMEIKDDIKNCQNLTNNSAKSACFSELKENIFSMAKFRMYNLVYKAEELKERGVDEEKVADFIVFLNQEKLKFNDAKTIGEKKDIIKEVKIEWRKFKLNFKGDDK